MYPISDLTAFCRKTTGDVPPKLVGASTTVVGSKMYLYGGRLVSERKMVSDIYMFDLETFKWERIAQAPEDDTPQARYFHSADTWRNHLIIFGGMAIKPQSDNPEDLCVLNDVRLFDLTSGHWLPAAPIPADSALVPNARYAHLSSVTADRLFIIGGQDLANVWLDDVYIFDLVSKTWIQRRDYPRHCGTYRSVAVTADQRVRLPQEELRGGQASARLGQPGTRFNVDKKSAPAPNATQSDGLIHLPYSAAPTDDYPCDIFLFSNYNFTDVQRELEVFTPLSDGDFTVSDRSSSMTGTSFPPGLRFPTGAILGTFFIVAGTYLSQTYQSFSIWALDLINMTWSRIDPGSALATGSWFRSCLWASANKFVVFGNRHGNLVEDYNRRLLSWDHVTCIDLEAFGIYQPPPLVLDIPMQELGLAALEEGLMADFEIICDDGRRIKVSRKLLEDRWGWFKDQRRLFLQAASRALEAMPSVSSHTPNPDVPNANRQEQRPDPRLTARSFNLSEPYPITLAFVQYFYSMSLITPLQHAPAVLSQLLLLSSTYQITHLQGLVKHAMHRALSYATSVGIYGVSTLCSCRSLQIRALRVVMAYSQKRPAGGRKTDKDAGPGNGRSSDAGGGGGGNGRLDTSAARPRGMSDAAYMRGGMDSSASRGFTTRGGMNLDFESGMTVEPLSVLADLQEFGLSGQEMPLPPTSSPSPNRRVSDSSGQLPPLSEDHLLEFSTTTALKPPSTLTVRPPPPNMPLPSVPGQQSQRLGRMAPLDSLPPDPFGDREPVPMKSLPVPRPRRMGSMDTISSLSSSRDGRSDRGQMSPGRVPSPQLRSLARPFSIMSMTTDQDLLAIAEMLSPTVAMAEEEPIPEGPPLEELSSFQEMPEEEPVSPDVSRESHSSTMSSIYSAYRQQQAPNGGMSIRGSIYTDSDIASVMGDDLPDPSLLSPHAHHGARGFAYPRGTPALDDSRSLSSATSYSSLRTPSLSRTSSLAYLASPPISPASSLSPIDGPTSSPHTSLPHPNAKLLGTIEESHLQEEEYHRLRGASETPETLHGDEYLDDEPQMRPYSGSRADAYAYGDQHRQSPSRSGSRSEMRGAVPSLYQSDPRGNFGGAAHSLYKSESMNDLRGPSPSSYKLDSRSDLRNSGPSAYSSEIRNELRAPQRSESRLESRNAAMAAHQGRRPPELPRLQTSNVMGGPTSAPAQQDMYINASSPFGHRQSPSPQPRSAYPSAPMPRNMPFASHTQNRLSVAEKRAGFIQDRSSQSTFQSSFSIDEDEEARPVYPVRKQGAPPSAFHERPTLYVSTPTRADAMPSPSNDSHSHRGSDSSAAYEGWKPQIPTQQQQQQQKEKLPPMPPMPPVPPSPVMSVSSGSSGHRSVSTKKGSSGLGKLFGRKSDKASAKSSESTLQQQASNKSVTSLELGLSKAEEKRLKKEAARLRTERLAQDLAEKSKRRAEEAKAAKESRVKERTKKTWEEGGGMYEGISYF